MTAPTDPESRAMAAAHLVAMDASDAAAAHAIAALEARDCAWRLSRAPDLASLTEYGDRLRALARYRLRCLADPLLMAGELSRGLR